MWAKLAFPPGSPSQAGGDTLRHGTGLSGIPFPMSALDTGAKGRPAATYMPPSTHPPAQLKLFVSICSEGGAVLICMCHTCSNNSSPLTRLRANNCKFRSHFIDEETGTLKPNNTALPPEGPSTQAGSTHSWGPSPQLDTFVEASLRQLRWCLMLTLLAELSLFLSLRFLGGSLAPTFPSGTALGHF